MGAFDHLGPALSRLRHDRGLLQREVARRADLTKSMVSHYEREVSRPSLGSLEKLLDALEADLVDLHRAMVEIRRLDEGRRPPRPAVSPGVPPAAGRAAPGPDPQVSEVLSLLARAFEEASEHIRRQRDPEAAEPPDSVS